MAQTLEIEDVDHYCGGDLAISPTGDLARVSGARRSEQRVLRRIMTNPGDYIAHLDYGGGVPAAVGGLLNLASVRAGIRGQMLLEASVAPNPEPTVEVRPIPSGVTVDIRYIAEPGRVPASLGFDLEQDA